MDLNPEVPGGYCAPDSPIYDAGKSMTGRAPLGLRAVSVPKAASTLRFPELYFAHKGSGG